MVKGLRHSLPAPACQIPPPHSPVPPSGFVRIRHFGFLANRGRTGKLARSRALLAVPPIPPTPPESPAALVHWLTGVDIIRCPACCVGRPRVVAVFGPRQIPALDTS